MRTPVIARIAKIVPLAVVAAVGMTACTGGGAVTSATSATSATSSAAATAATAATPSPSASVAATPTAAASATPSAPATTQPAPTAGATSAPTTGRTTAPVGTTTGTTTGKGTSKPSAKPTAPKPSAQGIEVTFNGLSEGSKIKAGGTVSFSVTWKNGTGRAYDRVAPVVASRFYDGAACGMIAPMAHGTLERRDASGWTELPLSQGTGMDYATSGDKAAFPLAPGASRTIEYRLHLAADNRPGRLPIEADAYPAFDDRFPRLGSRVVNASVVDDLRPSVSVVSGPTGLVVGGAPAEFTMKATAAKGTGPVRPVITLPALVDPKSFRGDHFIMPQDVTVEARVGGAWKQLPVEVDCNDEIAVDPAAVKALFPAGAGQVTFRVGVKKAWNTGNKLAVEVGAESGGHYAAPVVIRPAVKS